MKSRFEYSRRGLTLVEILVVAAVIFILLALFLPFYRGGAGGAARRAQCANHLRQLGLSLHNYESSHQCFPAAFGDPAFATASVAENQNRLSGMILLLPYLEQGAVYDELVAASWGPSIGTPGFAPWEQNFKFLLLCPSDPAEAGVGTNYVFCVGDQTQGFGQPIESHGVFGFQKSAKLSEIVDGSSNTIMMSETLRWRPADRGLGAIAQVAAAELSSPVALNQKLFTDEYQDRATLLPAGRGQRWYDGAPGSSLFNSSLLPGSGSYASSGSPMADGIYSLSAEHSGVVNFLYADGSVSLYSRSDKEVDLAVWQQKCRIDDVAQE